MRAGCCIFVGIVQHRHWYDNFASRGAVGNYDFLHQGRSAVTVSDLRRPIWGSEFSRVAIVLRMMMGSPDGLL